MENNGKKMFKNSCSSMAFVHIATNSEAVKKAWIHLKHTS